MKALLMKRGDVIREFGVSDYLMRAIEKSKSLPCVRVKRFRCRLYRRSDVERFVYGQKGPTSL